VITIHPHEARLQQAKTAQREAGWQQSYRATRPKVERKIAHFTRQAWADVAPAAEDRPASSPT
jgi:hypothetical protein